MKIRRSEGQENDHVYNPVTMDGKCVECMKPEDSHNTSTGKHTPKIITKQLNLAIRREVVLEHSNAELLKELKINHREYMELLTEKTGFPEHDFINPGGCPTCQLIAKVEGKA